MSLKLAFALSIAPASLLAGCAPTLTSEAQGVFVHSQVSNLLDNCERLGNVSVSVTSSNRRALLTQAKNNIRHDAYVKYGADTVAIVNIDGYRNTITVQAIALKCNK